RTVELALARHDLATPVEAAAHAVLEPEHPLHGVDPADAPALLAFAAAQDEGQVDRALADHALSRDEAAVGAVERVLHAEAQPLPQRLIVGVEPLELDGRPGRGMRVPAGKRIARAACDAYQHAHQGRRTCAARGEAVGTPNDRAQPFTSARPGTPRSSAPSKTVGSGRVGGM